MYEPDADGRKADVPELGTTHLVEIRKRCKSHVRFGGGMAQAGRSSPAIGGAVPTQSIGRLYLTLASPGIDEELEASPGAMLPQPTTA